MDAYQFRLRWVMSFPRRRESSKNERRSVLPAARASTDGASYWVPACAGTTGLFAAIPQREVGAQYFVIPAKAGI